MPTEREIECDCKYIVGRFANSGRGHDGQQICSAHYFPDAVCPYATAGAKRYCTTYQKGDIYPADAGGV